MDKVVIAGRRYYLVPERLGTVEILDHFGQHAGSVRISRDGQAIVIGPRGWNAAERQTAMRAAQRTGGLATVA